MSEENVEFLKELKHNINNEGAVNNLKKELDQLKHIKYTKSTLKKEIDLLNNKLALLKKKTLKSNKYIQSIKDNLDLLGILYTCPDEYSAKLLGKCNGEL